MYGSYYQVHGGRGLIPSSTYNLRVFNNMSLFQLDILRGQRAEGGERKQKKKLTWLKTYFGKQIRDKTKTLLMILAFNLTEFKPLNTLLCPLGVRYSS